MRKNPWVERAKNVIIALLAVILLALTVLALPVKTVTDTPWLAALVRPFALLMGISQGDLTDTPMADAGSVTGAAQPVSVSVRNPAGRTSFQYSFSTLDASFEQFGAALGQALETAQGDGTDKRASRAGGARENLGRVLLSERNFIEARGLVAACGHRSGHAEPLVHSGRGRRVCDALSCRRGAFLLPDADARRKPRAAAAKLHAGRKLLRL